ncbi:hypothetical protein [Mycolicibacterium mengxianglii]|uniref:hypothetical protein n=1 Tax=Mycolicibacterium mengxianglii TaxID=2736649 RepID=UPI001E464367|nr:hypothetical protein [Mycolicibacterium mengxianglii]
MMTALRKVLGYRVSVEALLELALWLAIPYIFIGLVLTFVNPLPMQALQAQLYPILPAGADLVAFGESTLLWPLLQLVPFICPS